ncbi:MAG: hypothetical protein KJ697_01470 [Nanoarchaeota archaeon]|nr:hypothetical protein [Nanoarchaeota archaeon]
MSEILCQMFSDRFPLFGMYQTPRVLIYDGEGTPSWEPGMRMVERIHLELYNQEIHDKNRNRVDLIKPLEVKKIAGKVFNDISHEFYDNEDGSFIKFLPEKMDDYSLRYDCHEITVQQPFTYPKIMFSIGNRGRMDLHGKQRQKYFKFATDIYEAFLKNARKL